MHLKSYVHFWAHHFMKDIEGHAQRRAVNLVKGQLPILIFYLNAEFRVTDLLVLPAQLHLWPSEMLINNSTMLGPVHP